MELMQEMNLEKNNSREEFLNSTLWKTINNGIDIGLRYVLPDLLEDEIIDLKNNLINYGLKDGIKKSIESIIDTGKQAIGIFSGNFQNVGQLQSVIKNGGIVDKVSDVIDFALEQGEKSGKINNTLSTAIKKGKDSILYSVEKNIESTLNEQVSAIKKIDKYINNWRVYYEQQNFEGMQKEFNKIEKGLKELVPIENTLKNARYIENVHMLIKNRGGNFEFSEDEIELMDKLNIDN